MRRFLLLMALISLGWIPVEADDDDTYLLRPTGNSLNRIVRKYRLTILKSLPAQNLYLVKSEDDDFLDNADDDRAIENVERNERLLASELQSGSFPRSIDPLAAALARRGMVDYYGKLVWESYVQQPARTIVGVPQAQSRLWTGAGVVAVIDTGVDPNHPALRNSLVSGYDFTKDVTGIPNELEDLDSATAAALTQSTTAFIDSTTAPVPVNAYTVAGLTQSTTAFIDGQSLPAGFGHGTMVASMVLLAAPTARIMPLKTFLSDGSSDLFEIIRAVYYAADNGARVINMSFSMSGESQELATALNYASSRQVVLVSSAGNDGNLVTIYPAAFSNVIGIASTTDGDERSAFSNYGTSTVSLAAPGEAVLVAYPGNNYASVWGTSFSTPLVAGAAALVLQQNSQSTPAQVDSKLRQTAVPLTPDLGAGRLNVANW